MYFKSCLKWNKQTNLLKLYSHTKCLEQQMVWLYMWVYPLWSVCKVECCPDHIHMLVRIPPNISVSEFMGYLKEKSSLMIFDRHANLKYKYGNR